MSWWHKLVRQQDVLRHRPLLTIDYDHQANRIEKERCNAERMGLQLVVEAAPLSDYYVLWTTSWSGGKEVVLYNEQGTVTIPCSKLYWNGPYLWVNSTR